MPSLRDEMGRRARIKVMKEQTVEQYYSFLERLHGDAYNRHSRAQIRERKA